MLPASAPGPLPNSLQMLFRSVSNLDFAFPCPHPPSPLSQLASNQKIMLNNGCREGRVLKVASGLSEGVIMSHFNLRREQGRNQNQ